MRYIVFTALMLSIWGCSDEANEMDSYSSEMALIESKGAVFTRGSSSGDPDELPLQNVSFSYNYYIDIYEITQGFYQAVTGTNPSNFTNSAHYPIEMVSWEDAALFCNSRSRKEGFTPVYNETSFEADMSKNGYRLPTEAEWEFAYRGGEDTEYPWGNDSIDLYVWYDQNSELKTHTAGTKAPVNRWGLYDMGGSVWEWCHDWYAPYDSSDAVDPSGPNTGSERVRRGGSFMSPARDMRSANRYYGEVTSRLIVGGFRTVRKVQ